MGHTLTVRIDKELAAWLEAEAARTGVSQGKIVREELERAKKARGSRSFMRLAGTIDGPKDLSQRKGFSRR
jgi:Ribbon-helix-helix protein, copG family